MPKFIIGLTGSLGSGCTTTTEYIAGKGYKRISISKDILEPLAQEKNENFNTRENKQNFGNKIRKDYKDKYRKKLLELISQQKGDVVIECFRNPMEIDFIRDEFPHFYLIALYAEKDERRSRKPKEDDFDNCDERDSGEKENKFGQQVSRCVKQADIILNNSRWEAKLNQNEYYKKIDHYLDLLRVPFRKPSNDEMMMHLAYSVSLHSTCIQRQVGAVITDDNYRILSIGYNDVPRKNLPCLDLHSQCYRKIKKLEIALNTLKVIKHCPFCGNNINITPEEFSCITNLAYDKTFICDNCGRDVLNYVSTGKELDFCRSLHAEENAILSNPFASTSLYSNSKEMIIFTTTFPCMLCAKKIANAGIKKVVFVEPYPLKESYEIFKENNIETTVFEGVKSLSFNWIFRKRGKFLKEESYRKIERAKNCNN